jgi:hypothetical protein
MTKPVDSKQFYRTPWGMAFMSYLMAMGLVGVLTPPDILTVYSWTRPSIDFMASFVSQIDKVTAQGVDHFFVQVWLGFWVLLVLRAIKTPAINNHVSYLPKMSNCVWCVH